MPEVVERDRQELELQMALGGVLRSSKSWSHTEAARTYARAQDIAEKLGETAKLVAVLMGLVSSALGSGRLKLGRELGERMLVVARRSKDPASLCAAHTYLGQALIWSAQYVEAQKHLELGSSYYDEADRGEEERGNLISGRNSFQQRLPQPVRLPCFGIALSVDVFIEEALLRERTE